MHQYHHTGKSTTGCHDGELHLPRPAAARPTGLRLTPRQALRPQGDDGVIRHAVAPSTTGEVGLPRLAADAGVA